MSCTNLPGNSVSIVAVAGGFDGDVVVTVGDGTLGFGGTTGFCILEGFGGRGGRFWSPVVCLLIGLYVAGECVSMMFSICCKHVLMDDKRDAYCFGLEIMASNKKKMRKVRLR